MTDKIDKLLEQLSSEDIDALFARLLHKRANQVSHPENKVSQSAKRFRSGSGQDNDSDLGQESGWIPVARGRRNRGEIIRENPVENIPGFPITIQDVPTELVKNAVAISKVIKQVCPGAKIKSQRSFPDNNRIVLHPADLTSSEQLLVADFTSTPLEGVKIVKDLTRPNNLSVLITGVDPCVSESEVEEELKRQMISIKGLNRMKAPNGGTATFKVKVDLLDSKQKDHLLANGTYIGYTRHRVLDFKPLPNVLVCYNCQEFDHHSKDCKKPAVCVRCGDEHKVTDCTRPNPICCHCFGFHSGAYRGCPVYKEKQKELAMKREAEQIPQLQKPPSRVHVQESKVKEPDYDKIVNVLTEVLFLSFEKIVPDTERNQTSLLSDLCLLTTEAMSFYTKKKFEAPQTFTACKGHLRELGFFRPLQSSQSVKDKLGDAGSLDER